MTLIEAIKSGRPFRRKSVLSCWYGVVGDVVKYQPGMSDAYVANLKVEDILADDWEIQEPTVTISASQFWEACQYATAIEDYEIVEDVHQRRRRIETRWQEVARRLGIGGEKG